MVPTEKSIVFRLPLTTATGKVRVKRRTGAFGEPFATSSIPLAKEDYFEWQISYFVWLDDIWKMSKRVPKSRTKKMRGAFGHFKSEELITEISNLTGYTKKSDFISALKPILAKYDSIVVKKPHKGGREFVTNELADLFRDAWKNKMIGKEDIKMLLEFNTGEGATDIEASYKVKSQFLNQTISEGFECYKQETPLFIKKVNDTSFVEIALKHKQRAVGFQSMVYFGFYLTGATSSDGHPIIGRTSRKGELVTIQITKEHLIWMAKAFIIASESHSWDMKKILEIISSE